MRNIEQLLNKENWIKYLDLADEGGIANHVIAQDIVSMIGKAINFNHSCVTDESKEAQNIDIENKDRGDAFNIEVEQLAIDCNCGWLTCENIDCSLIRCKKGNKK